MLNYKRKKQLNKIKYKCLDIMLYPIVFIYSPIYELLEKRKKNKRYSYKKIKELVKYCIDYHLNYDKSIYIVATNYVGKEVIYCGGYGYRGLCDIGYENNRIRKKIIHIYHYQKDEYIKALKELSGDPLTTEEKKNEFSCEISGRKYYISVYYRLQDKEVYKINQNTSSGSIKT